MKSLIFFYLFSLTCLSFADEIHIQDHGANKKIIFKGESWGPTRSLFNYIQYSVEKDPKEIQFKPTYRGSKFYAHKYSSNDHSLDKNFTVQFTIDGKEDLFKQDEKSISFEGELAFLILKGMLVFQADYPENIQVIQDPANAVGHYKVKDLSSGSLDCEKKGIQVSCKILND